jgi:hypothetical protein
VTKTYVLSDPVSGQIRYVGRTSVNVEKRLKDHMSTAIDSDLNYMPGWLFDLKRRGKAPVAIVIADFDNELAAFRCLKSAGAKLFNQHTPPPPGIGPGMEMRDRERAA